MNYRNVTYAEFKNVNYLLYNISIFSIQIILAYLSFRLLRPADWCYSLIIDLHTSSTGMFVGQTSMPVLESLFNKVGYSDVGFIVTAVVIRKCSAKNAVFWEILQIS